MAAALCGHTATVQSLVSAGADMDTQSNVSDIIFIAVASYPCVS